ncbi:MAG: rhodanese-like domain-containing protein [Caldilineae bacterium]|nr:rhodanese-like domain-containing protein [Chloroflexota bacterium]MCB9175628.1 rhodanese-like domain-containing protein [Caldilineae bacterium]
MKKQLQIALRGAALSMALVGMVACGDAASDSPSESAGVEAPVDGAGSADTSDTAEQAPAATEASAVESGGEDASAGSELVGCAAFEAESRFLPVADLVAAIEDPTCEAGQNLVFVDARPQLDFEYGHIPGAINVPYFNVAAFVDELPRDKWLVIYCECPHAEAVQAADALTSPENGFTMVKVIDEGLGGWRDLGREIVTGGDAAAGEATSEG